MKKIKKYYIFLILFLLISCGENINVKEHHNGITTDRRNFLYGESFPKGSTDILIIDQHWAEFTLKDKRFLFFAGTHSSCAITRID